MSWLEKIALPFDENQLLYGIDALGDIPDVDLPRCPKVLVIVDVQEEFNKCIGFDCEAFLMWLKQCHREGTEFHVIYDELGNEPTMFSNLGVLYYAKFYGADPYEGVIDSETGDELDASEMEWGEIYFDPAAQMEIFLSSGHEYQHITPDMEKLVRNLKNKKDIIIVGGAANECLSDMMEWLNMREVQYSVEWRFTY